MNSLGVTLASCKATLSTPPEYPPLLKVHTVVTVDSVPLVAMQNLPLLDFKALWLSSKFEGEHYLLGQAYTSCHYDFDESTPGVWVSHRGSALTWSFPAEYHAFLVNQGLTSAGAPREVRFVFNQRAYTEAIASAVDKLETLHADFGGALELDGCFSVAPIKETTVQEALAEEEDRYLAARLERMQDPLGDEEDESSLGGFQRSPNRYRYSEE